MLVCSVCFAPFPEGSSTCPVDGGLPLPEGTHGDRELRPGETLGDYRVEAKLGQGGFGAVYRARHVMVGKPVALKVLDRAYVADPETLSRFVTEARIVNDIQSEHIVDIFGHGVLPDGRHYHVMELLVGESLEDRLARQGALSATEALPVLVGVARALDAAHVKGVVHRDLKPGNVFLVADARGAVRPKLLDFGIAKLAATDGRPHRTRTGVPIGTPHYMAPEQCGGEHVDARADVYALGVLAFELLTGRLPFEDESLLKLMLAHASKDPPVPSSVAPWLGATLDAPLLAMLEKRPEARPATCGAAVAALEAACMLRASEAVSPAPRVGGHEHTGSANEGDHDPLAATVAARRRTDQSDTVVGEPATTTPPAWTAAPLPAPPTGAGARRSLAGPLAAVALLAVGGVTLLVVSFDRSRDDTPSITARSRSPATAAPSSTPSTPPAVGATASGGVASAATSSGASTDATAAPVGEVIEPPPAATAAPAPTVSTPPLPAGGPRPKGPIESSL